MLLGDAQAGLDLGGARRAEDGGDALGGGEGGRLRGRERLRLDDHVLLAQRGAPCGQGGLQRAHRSLPDGDGEGRGGGEFGFR
ncbi:hypothetical protein ACN28I_23190 [Archangium gephyra]|uniref:hypothetical protein n=1 Tax=Archangium gephyra TaxID=48 RepID=UPI003B7896EE